MIYVSDSCSACEERLRRLPRSALSLCLRLGGADHLRQPVRLYSQYTRACAACQARVPMRVWVRARPPARGCGCVRTCVSVSACAFAVRSHHV